MLETLPIHPQDQLLQMAYLSIMTLEVSPCHHLIMTKPLFSETRAFDSSSNAYGVGWIDKLNPKQDLENRFWENQDSTLAQSWYQHDWDLNDISVFNPSSGFTHELVGINGATTKLIDVEPIQSVIEPNRFTQDKNMWWNVEISHSESNLQAGHSVYVPKQYLLP